MREVAVVSWGLLVAVGFASGTAHAEPGDHGDHGEPVPPAAQVSTINGVVPEGILAPLEEVSTMIDTIDVHGQRIVVFQGVRKPGTRAPIHIHEHGGVTCVLRGTMTDFVEGQERMTFPAGTCYYMPPNVPMAAANLGTEDVFITDTFTLPQGAPIMTVIEPGWTDPDIDDAG